MPNIQKNIVLILVFLANGCIQPLRVKTEAVEKTPLFMGDPEPLKLSDVELFVTDNLVCTDVDGYKNLSLNLDKMIQYIVLQKNTINTYKKYYESK